MRREELILDRFEFLHQQIAVQDDHQDEQGQDRDLARCNNPRSHRFGRVEWNGMENARGRGPSTVVIFIDRKRGYDILSSLHCP